MVVRSQPRRSSGREGMKEEMKMRRLPLLQTALLLAAGACASIVTYPGAKGSIDQSLYPVYSACEREQFLGDLEPQDACFNFGWTSYRIGSPGWFRYMVKACDMSHGKACAAIPRAALGSIVGGSEVGFNDDPPPIDTSMQQRALAVGLNACQVCPSLGRGTRPAHCGDACGYSARLLVALHPERKAEVASILHRGCEDWNSTVACGLLQEDGGEVNWDRVEARNRAEWQREDRAFEERLQDAEEDRRWEDERSAGRTDGDGDLARSLEESQEGFQQQVEQQRQIIEGGHRREQERIESEQRAREEAAAAAERRRQEDLDRKSAAEAKAERDREERERENAERERRRREEQERAEAERRRRENERRASKCGDEQCPADEHCCPVPGKKGRFQCVPKTSACPAF